MKYVLFIAAAVAMFAFSYKPTPRVFKDDMEDFKLALDNAVSQLATATTRQDSVNIMNGVNSAKQYVNNYWDVEEEMKNASSLWPGTALCHINCAGMFLLCDPTVTSCYAAYVICKEVCNA